MRARNLKPAFFQNEDLGSSDPLHSILFPGLWCAADREGRLEDRPLRLCVQVFPYRRDITPEKLDSMLTWLERHDFIRRYEAEGKRYIQVLEFKKHQRPHSKEKESVIPSFNPKQHQPRRERAPTKVAPSTDLGDGEHALTPDSGSLTPDSGSLITDSHGARQSDDSYVGMLRIKAAYPRGIYRQTNWVLAERHAVRQIEDGAATWDELTAAARRYCTQCQARGCVGGQYVLSPEKFFAPDTESEPATWRDPFPLPESGIDQVRADLERQALAAESRR